MFISHDFQLRTLEGTLSFISCFIYSMFYNIKTGINVKLKRVLPFKRVSLTYVNRI